MPRGRHRHSPPLHRLLPPSTVAGTSLACAAGAWFVGDDLVQRVLAAGAAAAAVTGAVLLRAWDRKAGRRVAELTRARVRDEWRTEERIAELETDIEESREIRTALDTKLRAKRAELARLRSEHAELLRRYATAETERASALEGRRLLAIESGTPAKALPALARGVPQQPQDTPAAEARRTNGAARHAVTGAAPTADGTSPDAPSAPGGLSAAVFARADQALGRLARNAAEQRDGQPGHQGGDGRTGRQQPAGPDTAGRSDSGRDGEDRQGKPEAAAARSDSAATAAAPALRTVPPASAAVALPTAPRPTASRTLGGFDFFGTGTFAAQRPAAPLEDDLADVVGDEALAEQSAHATARLRTDRTADRTAQDAPEPARAGTEAQDGRADAAGRAGDAVVSSDDATADAAASGGAGEVIDLTAHDETEQLDVAELRSAIS